MRRLGNHVERGKIRRRPPQDIDEGLLGVLVPVERAEQNRALDLGVDAGAVYDVTRQSVVELLQPRFLRQPVLDMTGLAGFYDVNLEWMPETATAPETAGTSIFAAVQEQLGLKLEARKGPLEVIVVDHAERVPVEN